MNKIALLIFLGCSIGYSYAADSDYGLNEAQRNLDRIDKEKQQNFIRQEKQREKQLQQGEAAQKDTASEEARPSKYRFTIKEIVIENDEKFEFSAARNEIVSRYENTIMGEQEVLQLIKELTDFYISRGYATTQVTIIPGSLRSEKLELRVLWGKISGFLHNGEKPGWREKARMFSAMPFAKENVLNMSDIDQGLDNILRVSSSDRLLIEPDDKYGYSRINHIDNKFFPFSVYLGMNNSGYRNTGWYQYSINTSLKNVLGLNDTISYYYSYNDLYAEDDNQAAKSFSFNLPLGYWLFETSYYKSSYKKTIGGMYGGYVSDGQSERLSFKTSRTVYRNATGKYSAWLKTEKRINENNIMGFPIAVSSKNYSSIAGGLTWVGSLYGGWGYADFSMTAGLPWFGAAWKEDRDLNGFDLDYKKYNGTLSWNRRLATSSGGKTGLDYELNSGFQFTHDRLVSDASYNLGDEFTVRGYKENSVAAERALWLSNTLKVPVQINYARINTLSPFVGFDIGMARRNCAAVANTCMHDYMSGAATGIKLNGKDFSGSFSGGWPVTKPASLKNSEIDNFTLYFSLNAGF